MLYAKNNGNKILPEKHLKGHCPDCGDSVIAKCGEVNQWHWAHVVNAECKNNKPETIWHKEWKLNFPQECVEEKIKNHRADVFINGVAIEFQASTIARPDIVSRNEVFKNVFWVLNAQDKNIFFGEIAPKTLFYYCRWLWRRTSFDGILAENTRIFLDIDDGFLFLIKNKKAESIKNTYGEFTTKDFFIRKMKGEIKPNYFLRVTRPVDLDDNEKEDIKKYTKKVTNDLFEDIIEAMKTYTKCFKNLTLFVRSIRGKLWVSAKCECYRCKYERVLDLPKYITDRQELR